MKRMSLLAMGIMLTTLTFAQRAHTEFGIKGGVNIANIKDDKAPSNTSSLTGFHIGALAHIHIMPKLAIQPEVVYSSQGAEYSFSSYIGKDKLNYINIPVLAQYMFGGGFRLQTGPQLGIMTDAKFKNSNGTETDITSLKSTDFSWAFGAGYVTTSGLGFDARYNLGLSNLYKTGSLEAKNRVWQLGVFYQFHH